MGTIERIGKRLAAGALLLSLCCSALTGCGQEKEKIRLSIWVPEAKIDLMDNFVRSFRQEHEDEVEIDYQISREDEDTCRDTILANPEGAADIFAFADDQLDDLREVGALLEIPTNPDEALKPFGGKDSVAYQSVVRDGKLYAYPETANGYFMYYNKKYFKEEDVKDLDRMVEIAGNTQKKVTMDFSSGWYIYSFFKGAGFILTLDDNGEKNVCNWNATDTQHTGLGVAQSMMSLVAKRGFESRSDDEFVEGVKDGTVIAGVNGAWNADAVKEAWGDDYAATCLPTYTLDGQPFQMASFAGYKVLGISAHTSYPDWCRKFVEYVTSKENQIYEFEKTGEVPANLEVTEEKEVQDAPAVVALGEQLQFATLQRVASSYWDATAKFGAAIASGNPDKKDLQSLLDDMVKEITE